MRNKKLLVVGCFRGLIIWEELIVIGVFVNEKGKV